METYKIMGVPQMVEKGFKKLCQNTRPDPMDAFSVLHAPCFVLFHTRDLGLCLLTELFTRGDLENVKGSKAGATCGKFEVAICELKLGALPIYDHNPRQRKHVELSMASKQLPIPSDRIEKAILLIRGQKVILDRDLAELYGVRNKALKQAVRRNAKRFPLDFMFELTKEEFAELEVTICDLQSR